MSRSLIRSAAMAFFTIATLSSAGATGTAPALGEFDAAFTRVSDYTYRLTSHEVRGRTTQDRVYSYAFMKPHLAKVQIISGDGSGNVAVWTGGDQISGKQRGLLSFVHMKVGLHDSRALSLFGFTLTDGLLQNVVAAYRTWPGKLTQRSTAIDGQPATLIQLSMDPLSHGGVTTTQLFISRRSHMPLHQFFLAGDHVVLDQSFSDIRVNTGLKPSDFSL
jgi:hypothetical protein